jgi:hypothetical protein
MAEDDKNINNTPNLENSEIQNLDDDQLSIPMTSEKPAQKKSTKKTFLNVKTFLYKGLFFLIPCLAIILSTPLWKFLMFPELKDIKDIKIAQEGIQKTYEVQLKKFDDIAKKLLDIELLKKDLEVSTQDLSNQIQAIKNLLEVQNKKPEASSTDSSSDSNSLKINNLIQALQKKELVKEQLDNLNKLTLAKDFKKIIEPLSDIDYEGTPNFEELVTQFNTTSSNEPKEDGSSKALSEKIISQVKQNIKITVDGKEVNQTKKDVIDKIQKNLGQKDLKKAIEIVESLKDDTYKTWLLKAKARDTLDNAIRNLKDYKGTLLE